MQYRFILQPYKGLNTRYRCPACNHRDKTFVRYIDTENNEQINDNVGRCNREDKCNYHYTPKQYFEANKILLPPTNYQRPTPKDIKPPTSFIQHNLLIKSLNTYTHNNFIQFLEKTFGTNTTQAVLSKYLIGTSKHWQGATIFWQIDTQGKVHTGKIMLYNPTTGKRIKQPFNHITWVHSVLKLSNFNLKQCLFGEHLLNGNNQPVAIVESEKTAIIASVYLPQFIWLAVGSLSNLNQEKCNVLKGKKCVLFPDLNAFDKWSCQAKILKHITNFQVSNMLELNATDEEKENGLDLADYLLRFPLQNFQIKQKININFDEQIDLEEASAAFDLWYAANPQGGIFQYGDSKYKVTPNK
jgi:hypothetical protein